MERVKAAAERAEAQQETAPAAEPDAHGAAPPLGAAGLLGAQRESLARAIGLQHGNRHLSRLVAELQVARQSPAAPAATPLDQLRTLLEDEDVEGSITHMGTLGPVDVTAVLDSPAFRDLAVEAFGNNEMFRAVRAMNGNLRRSLEWMIEEGTDWDSVKTVIGAATSGQDVVRSTMRAQFVDLCGNDEMAEAVDLLAGDLAWKLTWMKEEGTSWSLVKPKIVAALEPEKAAVRADVNYRSFFVDLLGNAEMSEAVDLLGGDLAWKLTWMKEEGTDWDLVKPKVVAAPEAERAVVRGDNNYRDFFVSICGNEEMGEAVQLLGGTLEWKLGWIKEEGADWQRLVQVIAAAPEAERASVRNSADWKAYFVGEVDNEGMAKVVAGLGGTLEWRLGWMREEGTSWEYVARELKMQPPEAERAVIRASADWRAFFVDLCGNAEMSEALDLLGGTLDFKLQWMAAEGADWPQLKEKIALCTVEAEKAAVRSSADMKAFFVETCGNAEMADAVTLLGGDLAFKLDWMREEGADWVRVKGLIGAAPQPERDAVRTEAWKPFFVVVCGNDEMAEAVALLGGDLMTRLSWLEAEGTDWNLVKESLIACTVEAEKAAVRADAGRRDFFVAVCGNTEMAEAVDLLGGDLTFKLGWMVAEGADAQQVREKITSADQVQRAAVLADAALMKRLDDNLGGFDLALVRAALAGGMSSTTLTIDSVPHMGWDDLNIALRGADAAKKTEIRTGGVPWRDAFVSACGNDEMAEAVDLIEGELAFKLGWMQEEGTSWDLVKPKLIAAPEAERAPIRAAAWRAFFVDICDNTEMAEAVALLGGDLAFKLDWMLEEGTSHDLVLPVVTAATAPDKAAVAADAALCRRLAAGVGVEVFEALGSPAFVARALIDANQPDKYVEALRVIATAANVPATVAELRTDGRFETLLGSSPVGAALPAPAKTHVDTIFNTGAVTDPERKKLIRLRYRIEISESGIDGNAATPWGTAQLNAVYLVLGQIPDGSVLTNDEIDRLHLVVSGIGTTYSAYDAIHLPGGVGYNMAGNWPNASVVENHFQGTVRHEMGHAIDDLIGGEDWYMSDPNIDWDEWTGVDDWLAAMERLGGWGPVATDPQREQIRAVVRGHFGDASVNAPIAAPADPANAWNTFNATCPIVVNATLNQAQGAHNNFAAMPAIGNRVFTRRSEYERFYAYAAPARNPPIWVSNYGLSAPADWFAEQIREYLRTTPPGGTVAPFVASYFRMNLP